MSCPNIDCSTISTEYQTPEFQTPVYQTPESVHVGLQLKTFTLNDFLSQFPVFFTKIEDVVNCLYKFWGKFCSKNVLVISPDINQSIDLHTRETFFLAIRMFPTQWAENSLFTPP